MSVTYQRLALEVNPGDTVLLDDGAMELTVQSVGEREVRCRVVVGGTLRESKGVNLPDTAALRECGRSGEPGRRGPGADLRR